MCCSFGAQIDCIKRERCQMDELYRYIMLDESIYIMSHILRTARRSVNLTVVRWKRRTRKVGAPSCVVVSRFLQIWRQKGFSMFWIVLVHLIKNKDIVDWSIDLCALFFPPLYCNWLRSCSLDFSFKDVQAKIQPVEITAATYGSFSEDSEDSKGSGFCDKRFTKMKGTVWLILVNLNKHVDQF